jgi:hypothetical protein
VRSTLVAASLIAVLAAALFAVGCGSSSSSSSNSTSTPAAAATTTTPGRLGASAAPARTGYYAGVDCKGHSCSSYYSHASEGFTSYCKPSSKGVWPNTAYHPSIEIDGKEYNFVCFKFNLNNQTYSTTDFYYAGVKIVKSVHADSDRFPNTCDNGWCISGEWDNSTTKMFGTIRNPKGVSADYRAQWVASF